MPEISARIENLAQKNLAASQELFGELQQIFNQLKNALIATNIDI
jgi:hypothetical protein